MSRRERSITRPFEFMLQHIASHVGRHFGVPPRLIGQHDGFKPKTLDSSDKEAARKSSGANSR